MPRTGLIWRHVVLSTHGSWLPGDPRGFRDRTHRIHSSGDYKSRPPTGEHRGLHDRAKPYIERAVALTPDLRMAVGQFLVDHLTRQSIRVLSVAVASHHVHVLAELPIEVRATKRLIGAIKRECSFALRDRLPGRLWAGGGSFKPIRTRDHQRRAFRYILNHRKEGAWVWSYQDGCPRREETSDDEATRT